ncbi:hypothetical protein GUJ93_ZPchr0001g31646 [Zizania palustris]|uniref:Uncharacterized protein n=1 Tax=Zizania palustris TaxID=103762 RepID=A0A8J5VQ98_ZIZPA|nr:hypothetical protein GUJ93_ZPchr0001g31646 [Zizania palustris]
MIRCSDVVELYLYYTQMSGPGLVPSSVIALVSSLLRKGEDDLAQLYALRTIDNICSQGTDWTLCFASQDLANLMKILEAPFQAWDDFQMTLLRVLEAATEEPTVILNEHTIFTNRILPSLSVLYKGNKGGDARFLCLKILSDVMIVIFSDSSLTSDGQTISDLKMISQKYFLPMYPSFAEDEDPIPIYAQKLLVMLMEHGYVKVSDILNEATVSRCFEFCFALASAPDMDTNILSQLQVVRRIGNLLEFVTAKDMDDFLEPTLELCRAFIIRGIGSNKSVALSKEPALLVDSAFSISIAVDQQSCVMDISYMGSSSPPSSSSPSCSAARCRRRLRSAAATFSACTDDRPAGRPTSPSEVTQAQALSDAYVVRCVCMIRAWRNLQSNL